MTQLIECKEGIERKGMQRECFELKQVEHNIHIPHQVQSYSSTASAVKVINIYNRECPKSIVHVHSYELTTDKYFSFNRI